ncbi:hypothetical protein MPDQ_006184 [Monascus purpureus]|uniref:Uncharacterized protein n=1 Tax=Monascus purpureus TaxID=5098 RepID=A0A507QZH5_MONPU|nr:hypothetical protein MPDQ_006184 [Monascus purpureus]BDD60267.1 hypothetical protein MAP00_005407 [Monascus purpureus]
MGLHILSRCSVAVVVTLLLIVFWHIRSAPVRNHYGLSTMGDLSPTQKARLHEVADLMLEIYQTLAKMQYLDPAGIQPGPHDITTIIDVYRDYNLDPSVMYLYRILPYINTKLAGNSDFFHGGEFADFRNADDVERGRDPFFASPEEEDFEDEDGPYMRPWVTPLSNLGNHQSIIIYDARKHRIWIIDQEGWLSTDPALKGAPEGKQTSKNRNSFEHIPSRPAGDVLRDIVRWYRELEELPGGGENSGLEWNDPDLDLKTLYHKHGWPDNFDGDGFLVDKARAYSARQAKYNAEEPLRVVKRLQDWSKYAHEEARTLRLSLATAENLDKEWQLRFKIWQAERREARNLQELEQARREADALCPEGQCQELADLPLWEFEQVQKEYGWKKDAVQNYQNWVNESQDSDPELSKDFQNDLHRAQKEAEIYRRACIASKADAERLCPGKTLKSATGKELLRPETTTESIQSKSKTIKFLQKELEDLQQWETQIPGGAVEAKKMVEEEIQQFKQSLRESEESKSKAEERLAVHGDTM